MRRIDIPVSKELSGRTVEEILRRRGISRRLIVKLKRTDGGITVDGKAARTIDTASFGQTVSIAVSDDKSPQEANPNLKVNIVYEDDDLIVFDKPADMPVHPSHKHRLDTLGNAFACVCPGLAFRPINRLDRDTSGLCAVAKNSYAACALSGKIEKVYTAVICGELSGEGRIDAPIARERESIITRCVREDGQKAVTNYRALASDGHYTVVECRLETGRTHQIRVHFAYIGHPLAGDGLYGFDKSCPRQALHCSQMRFKSIASGEEITLNSPLPKPLLDILKR